MPANMEIKVRIHNFKAMQRRIEALSDSPAEFLWQEDYYFFVAEGRLKLRIEDPNRGDLIAYSRPNESGPKHSTYWITTTTDPEGLKAVLSVACGVRGVVRKMRYLFRVGQTRIHLDNVKMLGEFLELEVAMGPGQEQDDGRRVAADLLAKLRVDESDLCTGSYIDMLEEARFKDCLQALRRLSLPDEPGTYMVFGSGPLWAHGIRTPDDLDLIVSESVWDGLIRGGSQAVTAASGSPKIECHGGSIEIFRDWNDGTGIDVTAMMGRAERIDGIWYASLRDVLEWKRKRAKSKDAIDILLIEKHLSTREQWID